MTDGLDTLIRPFEYQQNDTNKQSFPLSLLNNRSLCSNKRAGSHHHQNIIHFNDYTYSHTQKTF